MIKEKRTVKIKVSASDLTTTLLSQADPMVNASEIDEFELDSSDTSFVSIKTVESDLTEYKEQRHFSFSKQELVDELLIDKYPQVETSEIDTILKESAGNFLVILKQKLFAEYQGV